MHPTTNSGPSPVSAIKGYLANLFGMSSPTKTCSAPSSSVESRICECSPRSVSSPIYIDSKMAPTNSSSTTSSVTSSATILSHEEAQHCIERSGSSYEMERVLGPSSRRHVSKDTYNKLQHYSFGSHNDSFTKYTETDFENDNRFYHSHYTK